MSDKLVSSPSFPAEATHPQPVSENSAPADGLPPTTPPVRPAFDVRALASLAVSIAGKRIEVRMQSLAGTFTFDTTFRLTDEQAKALHEQLGTALAEADKE